MTRAAAKKYFADAVPVDADFVRQNFARARSAEKNYRMWHQKEVDEDQWSVIDFPLPSSLRMCGRARGIVYKSDKWEKDWKFFDYMHDFDSRPSVFTKDGDGRAKAVAPVFGIPNVRTPFAIPPLSFVKWLELDDGKGNDVEEIDFGRRGIPMTCSPDRRALLILHRSYPIIITGGSMVVTERGIVR